MKMDIEVSSPRRSGYELGYAINMEVVNSDKGQHDQPGNQPGSSTESYESSTSESGDFSEEASDDDLKEDLQKTILQCYKAESNITLQSNDITNDEEFQATALCQFMDILNDLDEVLDKSLLACLDDSSVIDETAGLDSDDDDLICKTKQSIDYIQGQKSAESQNIFDDDTEVVAFNNVQPYQIQSQDIIQSNATETVSIKLGRSKSFSDLSGTQREALICSLERNNTTAENIRNSMRRLDPIVLPAITAEQPLTLPVILFLEHHVNMRPTSAPIQVQVTAANLSTDGSTRPLIVGRRTLLMNRTLSLPSPGDSDVTGMWTGRNNSRSTARSSSTSSSSMESLAGALSNNMTANAAEDRSNENDEVQPFGIWPHRMSAMLTCLSCTIGIFNLSRFAMLSINFGAGFIIQFFIISLLLGIPLFTLHLCLGQMLEAGPIDMWRVSPIFKGVGIALLLIQAVIGIYSMMGLSWIFVYFRDSFITSEDRYKWTLPYEYNFEDAPLKNGSFKIQETIPQYFQREVLQRDLTSPKLNFGTIKFQVAFNLAVVWMFVFIVLSKGLRSYGKAVYLLIFLPICATLVLCTKLLTLIPYDTVMNIFSDTEWSEFFIISHSWASATQEVFLTWGLLGPCIMQLTSHRTSKNKSSSVLQRESACIISFTFAMLLLAAFLANTCVQILKNYGYIYLPNFENDQFLWPISEPLPGNMASTPTRYMAHYSSLVGVTLWKSGNNVRGSSIWQPLQLATQIVPATLAVLPKYVLSPAWAVMFYFILIMFGLAQQLAIWHCVITGIIAFNIKALKLWETTITFLSCVGALALGLFLSTDGGMKIVQLLDITWVGSWLHCVLQIALTCGLFAVRGRPYSADVIVGALYASSNKLSATVAAILSFVWTVALPVLLCAICVMDFKIGQYRQFYTWRKPTGQWPIFVRQLVVLMQQGTLLLLPVTAFIQTWRYMSKGPPDILDRIQNLYRPRLNIPSETPPPSAPVVPPPDPPPKYTPPPSYSTATAARLMNTLTRSFRTLRRLTTSRPQSTQNTSQIPITLSESVDRERMDSQPPEYTGVFTPPRITVTQETGSRTRPLSSTSRNSITVTRDILRRSFVRKSDSVKSIRSSLRRSFKYGGALTTSHEHLVRDAEPISNTVAMSAMLDSDSTTHTRSLASVI